MKILISLTLIITCVFSVYSQDVQVKSIGSRHDTLPNGKVFRKFCLEVKNHRQDFKILSSTILEASAFNENKKLFEIDTSYSSEYRKPNNIYLTIHETDKSKNISKIKGKVKLTLSTNEDKTKSKGKSLIKNNNIATKYVDFEVNVLE